MTFKLPITFLLILFFRLSPILTMHSFGQVILRQQNRREQLEAERVERDRRDRQIRHEMAMFQRDLEHSIPLFDNTRHPVPARKHIKDVNIPGAYFVRRDIVLRTLSDEKTNSVASRPIIGHQTNDKVAFASVLPSAVAENNLDSNSRFSKLFKKERNVAKLQCADPFISTDIPRFTVNQETIPSAEASQYKPQSDLSRKIRQIFG